MKHITARRVGFWTVPELATYLERRRKAERLLTRRASLRGYVR